MHIRPTGPPRPRKAVQTNVVRDGVPVPWKPYLNGWRKSVSNWLSDTKRSDGLYVHKLADENWGIRFAGRTITACPCCGKVMPSARIARLVADNAYRPANGDGEPPPAAA
jgi:hypothetical protein